MYAGRPMAASPRPICDMENSLHTLDGMTPRAWAAFATMSILWGIPYLFIKIAVDDGVPPGFIAWARVLMGATVLLALAWRARALGGLRSRWRWLVAYAVIEISIPFPLIAFGEQHVSSSTTAIAIATVPLIASLLALKFAPGESLTGRRLIGMLVGFAGVAALVGIDVSGSADELLGIGAIVLAAAGYACGALIIARGLGGLDGRATMGASLAIATDRADAARCARPADRGAAGRRDRLDRRARARLHRGGVRRLRRAGHGSRTDALDDRHLRQPGDRARARRRAARRAAGRRRDRRPRC